MQCMIDSMYKQATQCTVLGCVKRKLAGTMVPIKQLVAQVHLFINWYQSSYMVGEKEFPL